MSSPLVLLSAFLITLAITWLVRIYAIKKSIVDIPNERSSHTISTPRGGGIAIVLVWMAGLSYLFVKGEIETNLFLALSSGMVLFVISLIDDVIDLKPAIRMAAQSVSVATALYFIGGVQSIDFGFFVFNHVWINTFLAFIGLIWFINLFNFLDGIDGYASAETILISLAFFALFTDYFLLILVFSTLGFLVWNWQSAKIFMGDVGSTVLGFTLGLLALYYSQKYYISIFTLLIPSALFWFDASLTLFRRWRNNEKLSEAHKKHAYQRLVQSGWSHQKVVVYSIGVNLVLFALAYGAFVWPKFVMLFFGVALGLLYGITRWVDGRKAFELGAERSVQMVHADKAQMESQINAENYQHKSARKSSRR